MKLASGAYQRGVCEQRENGDCTGRPTFGKLNDQEAQIHVLLQTGLLPLVKTQPTRNSRSQ